MRRIRWNLKFVHKKYVGRFAVSVYAMCPDDDDMAFNGDNTIVYLSKLYTGEFNACVCVQMNWLG